MDGHQQKYKRFPINDTIYVCYINQCDDEHINLFISFFRCFYTIYIQEVKMELDMKKNISSSDKISEGTLHEILLDIKYRLDHLEDIEADNRALIVKMIKQGNSIVKFLAKIDIEPIDNPFEDMDLPPITEDKSILPGKIKSLK